MSGRSQIQVDTETINRILDHFVNQGEEPINARFADGRLLVDIDGLVVEVTDLTIDASGVCLGWRLVDAAGLGARLQGEDADDLA